MTDDDEFKIERNIMDDTKLKMKELNEDLCELFKKHRIPQGFLLYSFDETEGHLAHVSVNISEEAMFHMMTLLLESYNNKTLERLYENTSKYTT